MAETTFPFVTRAARSSKPRKIGVTEIRGPYYSAYGPRHLADLLETVGAWVDGLKYAGGSFALMPADAVRSINKLAHDHDVYVSTGGWIENVMRFGVDVVDRYIEEAKALGFDVIEISTGFISLPTDGLLRLVQKVKKAGLQAKPELGIQFGAGGSTPTEELAAEGTKDVGWLIAQAERALDAGADIIMIESEGITENVNTWRTDVVARIINQLGLEKVMFEGADPPVFEWYVKHYGNEVNLFIDHSQIVQLEALRSGIWGTKSTWGRIQNLSG
ncbi:MAG: phosphosulfolactate synthase [Bradyrhizobium sp.]|uniref:phosphosulfolactate synthase n=1 Tax=Bradyrhizobium sp. TaxID=376 RepID=UPI001C2A1954|nr:phosphosulfolactate synthase [Bradyrhizobium sp.]MBU6463404.1 phosphosulfolactate synthase [Pseudomonadota bacterium]MDE2067461.1 phosphosulfolactate synthase [Bradyrhizobium sp.]MDE2241651.1 phosphosulfolactate synthase [Bradyrhizobium sp.]MDE2467206.1 phosphosulfolactate synthase [Bradyrhizobium sp.]